MNEKMEKLKDQFLVQDIVFAYITCRQSCDCCEDTLGCTKWKKIKTDKQEKIKKELEKLEEKKKVCKEELKSILSLREQENKKKELELISKNIEETKENKSERVKNFIIRLRDNADDDTIAHEFTHVFLVYHYNFGEHHGKGAVNEKNSPHFWSLKEWFLAKIKH